MLSSLPSRPLSLTEVTAVDQSEVVTFCRPILAFSSETPTDDIIACYLATGSTTSLIGYDETGGWTVIDRFDDAPGPDDFDRSSSAVLKWAETTHGPDGFVVLSTDEIDDGLARVLPAHPIGKADLPTLEALSGIDRVHPIFCHADSHEIIAFLSFQTDPTDPETFIMANYAYHPERESWTEIERAAIDIDQDIDPEADVTVHEWIEEHYDMDTVLAISPEPLE